MSNLKVFNSINEFILFRDSLEKKVSIGFIPTMGAFHRGHTELAKRSASENDLTIMSIFVNPTQFNNPEDLNKYPRTLEQDLKFAAESRVNFILAPSYNEVYPDNYKYKLSENSFSKTLCGFHRPGHFDGVLTVVMKLLQIVNPEKAYFGEKDFQQLQLIKDMAKAFFLRTHIVACETIREKDGLAMSSRNVRLSLEGRKNAPQIYRSLIEYKDPGSARDFLNANNIEVEYLEEHLNRRFLAVMIDGVRLIDNVAIN